MYAQTDTLDGRIGETSRREVVLDAALEGQRRVVRKTVEHPPIGCVTENDRVRLAAVNETEGHGGIRRMLEALTPANPHFSIDDCLELMDANPEWAQINCHVLQKNS